MRHSATSVDCYVYAKSTSGVGEVEFVSTTAGAVTGPQVIGATLDLYGPYALTIDASGGYETVSIWLDANGGAHAIDLAAVLVVVPPESSPLAAGELDSGCVAFDAGELAADEPLASAQGRRIIDNATTLRAVPHVYWNWSAFDHFPTDPLPNMMRSVPHVIPCVVWADTEREGWDLTVHVRATASGVDKYVYLHAGLDAMPGYDITTAITVTAGTTEGWVTGTLRVPSRRKLLKSVPGWETIMLTVYPNPTESDAPKNWKRREGGEDGMLSSAEIHSISVWGR
jgi:hypothetical protein